MTAREVLNAVFPGSQPTTPRTAKVVPHRRPPRRGDRRPRTTPIPITGLIPGMAVHFAGCCHPLPGDRIVGIVTTGKGVTIHTIDCETLESFADDAGALARRRLGARTPSATGRMSGGCMSCSRTSRAASAASRPSSARADGNISNLKITNRSLDFFEMMVDVEVSDVRHLTNIIAALRATPVVNSVERARG